MHRPSLSACAAAYVSLALFTIVGCVADDPPPPRAPSVVHIPLGWIGHREKPTNEAASTSTSETETESETSDEETTTNASPTTDAENAITIVPLDTGKPRSSLLPCGLANPLPGGVLSGYAGDTGLDIASAPHEVYAIAAGTLDYSEEGHTLWLGPKDTHFSVRIALDAPIPWKGHLITHAYYTHLSALEVVQHEGDKLRHHVEAGDALGTSGVANGLPHLHLGLLLDGHVEQDDWTWILREGEVRKVIGGWANGKHLPSP
jgi:hypothetical protein